MSRKLLKDGCVLSLDPKVGNFHKANVLIDGIKIAAVGPTVTADDAELVDAAGMIVMPGFIDTHRHTWEGTLRNIATNVPLEGEEGYLGVILNKLAPAYRPEDVYIGNLVSLLGAINAGITTLLDWSHIQASPDHTSEGIRALNDSGMRVVFGYGHPWWGSPVPAHDDEFRRLARDVFSSRDQLLTLCLASQGPEFMPLDAVARQWELARSVGARISVHVGVGTYGRHGKLQAMGEAGLLGPDTTYIHCTTLNDNEIRMIVDTGGTISISAPAEMMMGHGLVATQKFLDRGLRPSLSVDAETNMPGEMFTQMRTILSLQRALAFDRVLTGAGGAPDFLNARDGLDFATVQGARAVGMDSKIGTLTPGKEADIIMLNANRVNIMPVNDPIGAVVWGMDTSNVDTVFVAGRALKRGGKLLGHDLEQIQRSVYESRDFVVRASGFQAHQLQYDQRTN